jgi:predicted RNase H-like nuclease (RuvC/YqgF family)
MALRRIRIHKLGERLMATAVMHVGPEIRFNQVLERTIHRIDPEAPRQLIAEAVDHAIEHAKRRIADNQSEIKELEAGIARLKSFNRLYRSGLRVVS